MTQVRMNVSGIGGFLQLPNSMVQTGTDGVVTVDSRDAIDLLRAGATYLGSVSRYQALVAAPRNASAGRLVASTALSNGTLSIANQPDVPRVGALRIDTGTTAVTAGNVAISYVANDGSAQVDNVSCINPASTLATTNTSKGIALLSSVIVTAVAGGTSPKIQLNDTNILSVQVDPGFVDFACVQEYVDGAAEAVGTVSAPTAGITPTTTPNATHTFAFIYNYLSPNV